jgi:cytochrome c-type biogenesis protein CcmE
VRKKQVQFILVSVAIVLLLTSLGYSGFRDSMSYFQTVSQLHASGEKAHKRRLSVSGDVVAGSIVRSGIQVDFVIEDKTSHERLPVRYGGTEPVPDTFRDYATVIVNGTLAQNGVFAGTKMTAKCASKYEKEKAGS